MQFIIILMILFSLWVSAAPLVHSEDRPPQEPAGITVPRGAAENSEESTGSLIRESMSAVAEETGLENPLPMINRTVKETARTVGKSLGQFIRGQYQHMKNQDILARFDQALNEHLSGLPLTSEERSQMIRRIEQTYIEDSESGRHELDQTNFRDLDNLVRKEYSEILLSRSREGEVETYDLKGNLKTRWNLKGGRLNGPATTYYPNGEIKYIDLYDQGQKINRKKYDEEGKLVFEQNYSYEKNQVGAQVAPLQAVSQQPVQSGDVTRSEQVNGSAATLPLGIRKIPVTGSDDRTHPFDPQVFERQFAQALQQTAPDASTHTIPVVFVDSKNSASAQQN